MTDIHELRAAMWSRYYRFLFYQSNQESLNAIAWVRVVWRLDGRGTSRRATRGDCTGLRELYAYQR